MSFGEESLRNNPVTGEEYNPQKSPRYSGVSTFMRAPLLEMTGEELSSLDIGMVGVPFDGGVTFRPGARLGPKAVREASRLMRTMHHATQVAPFDLCRVRDLGDVLFRNHYDMDSCVEDMIEYFTALHQAGVAPLSVGGDHSISYPVLKAIAADQPIAMIHFDAHTDTMGPLFGAKFHHGAPFYHAAKEGLIDPNHCVQIGIRGSEHHGTPNNSLDMGMRVIFIEEFVDLGVEAVIAEARKIVGDMPTYLTFDVDGLDPIYAPGTGTPESGGISMREAQQILRGLRGINFVGADVVEVAPCYDPTEITAQTGATLMFEMLCLLSEATAKRKRFIPESIVE